NNSPPKKHLPTSHISLLIAFWYHSGRLATYPLFMSPLRSTLPLAPAMCRLDRTFTVCLTCGAVSLDAQRFWPCAYRSGTLQSCLLSRPANDNLQLIVLPREAAHWCLHCASGEPAPREATRRAATALRRSLRRIARRTARQPPPLPPPPLLSPRPPPPPPSSSPSWYPHHAADDAAWDGPPKAAGSPPAGAAPGAIRSPLEEPELPVAEPQPINVSLEELERLVADAARRAVDPPREQPGTGRAGSPPWTEAVRIPLDQESIESAVANAYRRFQASWEADRENPGG
ncbi:hypothetical protein GGS23DRAFT_619969, partial [Durotheca rogersii]|uniref:uncharacterized protein n=1 Tax=Durotheca rogersii TaxID=419775 RepID=UPI00221EE43C